MLERVLRSSTPSLIPGFGWVASFVLQDPRARWRAALQSGTERAVGEEAGGGLRAATGIYFV